LDNRNVETSLKVEFEDYKPDPCNFLCGMQMELQQKPQRLKRLGLV